MSAIGNTIKLVEVYNQMEILGRAIGNEDPCNIGTTVLMLYEQVVELINDLKRSVKKLVSKGDDNGGFIILAVIQEMFGPAFFSGLDGVMGFVMGNTLGVLMQAVALLTSSLQGIWLIIMYLSAKTTMKAIEERQGFIKYQIISKVDSIIAVYQALANTTATTDYSEAANDIKNAYDNIYNASLILGQQAEESTKSGGLNISKIKSAENQLEQAMKSLFGEGYTEGLETTSNMFETLGLSMTGSNNFFSIKFPSDLLTDVEFGEDSGIPLADYIYESAGGGGKRIKITWDNIQLISKALWDAGSASGKLVNWEHLFPGVPDPVKIKILMEVANEASKDLYNMVPMAGSEIKGLSKLVDKLEKANKPVSVHNMTNNILGIDTSENPTLDDFKSYRGATEDSTLRKVNSKASIAVNVMVMLKSNMFATTLAGNMYAVALMPILASLTSVRNDMKEVLLSKSIKSKSSYKKSLWGLRITQAKTSLKVFTTGIDMSNFSEDGEEVNFVDSSNSMSIEDKWDSMVEYITNEVGEKHPANSAYDMLQKIPSVAVSHLLGTLETVSGHETYLAYLQDIKSSLTEAIRVDSNIYSRCISIVALIENEPTFPILMRIWDNLTNSLTGAFGAFGSELAEGNLNSVAGALSNLSAFPYGPITGALDCAKNMFDYSPGFSFDPNLNPTEYAQERAKKILAEKQEEATNASYKLLGNFENKDYQEFVKNKEILKKQFLNESKKIQDLLSKLLTLYGMITPLTSGE